MDLFAAVVRVAELIEVERLRSWGENNPGDRLFHEPVVGAEEWVALFHVKREGPTTVARSLAGPCQQVSIGSDGMRPQTRPS